MLDQETLARFRALKPGMELTLSHRYRQPMEKVFAALSTPERIADWMGVEWQGDAGPLRLGSNFSYRFKDNDMPQVGHVTAYDPPRLIEHSWFEDMPPHFVVRWALEPAKNEDGGGGCILTLTQSTAGKDDMTRNGAGWTMIMGQLDAWLAGTPFEPERSWREVRNELTETLGPEAVRDGRRFTRAGKPVVEFKRVVDRPVPELWYWLTDPEKLVQWLGPTDVELRPGGAYRIHFTMAPIVMEGRITAVDPPHRLELIWREPWFKADNVLLAFSLEPHQGGRALLTLTHTFPETYDPHDYLAGWHDFLDVLEEAMDGHPVDWNDPARKQAYETREKVYKAVAGAEG